MTDYYLIKYNNNIIGAYDNTYDAEVFILSCLQNKFMENQASIVTCLENSCFFKGERVVKLDNNNKSAFYQEPRTIATQTDSLKTDGLEPNAMEPNVLNNKSKLELKIDTEPKDTIFVSQEYIDKCNKQSKLQHELNLLKLQKDKIDQSKKVYESDLKIYNIFKQKYEEDNTTVIPEIFKKKYDLFKHLEDNNNLSWCNFFNSYKHENMYNDHFNVTYHEEMYGSNQFEQDSEENSSDEKDNFIKNLEEEVNTSDFDNSPTYSNDEPSLCVNKYLVL